jgi:chorismate mutase
MKAIPNRRIASNGRWKIIRCTLRMIDRRNAFVDFVGMMKAALVIRHLSAPFFVHARQNAVTAQPLLDGSAFCGA